jgi:hypothetical protein
MNGRFVSISRQVAFSRRLWGMKRWLFAVAALLVGAAGLAHADYLRIIVNLGVSKERLPPGFFQDPSGMMPGMMPGGMPGGMMPGMGPGGLTPGGGGPGMMPGGMPGGMMPGMGPGGLAPGGVPGPGDIQGGGFQGGVAGGGFRGGVAGGGGFRGGAAGFQGGFPGGGFQGGRGGGDIDSADGGMPGMMPGGMMPGGMMPGGMMPGGMMPGGMMSGMMGVGGFMADEGPEFTPLYVVAVIEVDDKDFKHNKTTNLVSVKHKWGSSRLLLSADVEARRIPLPTLSERYRAKVNGLTKDRQEPRPEQLLELADWALTHGLLDEVPKAIDRLAKADPKHPVVAAFRKTQAAIDRPNLQDDGTAAAWRERLGEYRIRESTHYALVYDVPNNSKAQSWLDRLENHYRGFFYWFALRGVELPVPDRRLVAILVDSPEAFEHQHKKVFDELPMMADGFFARRDNLAVFSATRLDEGFTALNSTVTSIWRTSGQGEEMFFKGKSTAKLDPIQNIQAQTLTLVHKALREESELATVTHEGTRQLIAAMGVLPRSVQPPLWLDSGIASFFETPKGAFWPGIGAPSWNYLVHYKQWETEKKLDKPEDALRGVLTDRYFREAHASKNKEKALQKARTMAWALTYYLMHKKRDGLLRYYQELATMPRDLEFDADVLMGCFARAFDLVEPSKPNEVNPSKFYNLAKEWRQFIQYTPLEVPAEYLAPPKMPVLPQNQAPPGAGTNPAGGRTGGAPGGTGT